MPTLTWSRTPRGEGLDVEQADALAYLEALEDGSLGGIFAAQVVEHLASGDAVPAARARRGEASSGRPVRRRDDQPALAARAPQLLRRPHACAAPRAGNAGDCSRSRRASERSRRAFSTSRTRSSRCRDDPVIAANVSQAERVCCSGRSTTQFSRGREDRGLRAAGAVRARRRRDLRRRPRRRAARARARGRRSSRFPFKWYPGARVLTQAFLWRLLDLTRRTAARSTSWSRRSSRRTSSAIPNKRRLAAAPVPAGVRARPHRSGPVLRVAAGPRAPPRRCNGSTASALGEARRLFATSQNVADRLARSTGLAAEVLPHPPQQLDYRCDEYGDFVLSVSRLDRAKRIDLLLEAARRSTRRCAA